MFVDFFIERPIFAGVVAIVIVLAGAVCIPLLPIAQFPEIAPPTVQVRATYTGASAEVVEQSVTSPLEEQINGVEGMMYMTSTSASDGSSTINVTFEVGYDLNIAAVDVQNRVSMATSQLPEDVVRMGVTTQKQSTNFIQIVSLFSPDGSHDDLFLSNYASINIVDSLKRLDGVGDVTIFGERTYSMRIWMDPDRMANLKVTPTDVVKAIQNQNIQVAAGKIGDQPSPPGQVFTYTIVTKGRLSEPAEFEDIIVRALTDGSMIRVKDVATVELGAESYVSYSKLNGKSCSNIAVYQLPGANALDIAKAVGEEMENLSRRFPAGIDYQVTYDTTKFVRVSIEEVLKTLVEAFVLVFLVVYIFLQSWRTTLIPALTIPVSLIGTFAVMMALGFSINTLSLFGLVLAIGLVVDDAIVVVENVERCIHEKNMTPFEATKAAMREVVGPIVATTAVLMAVFVPVAFMPGISGRLYQQFALTIAISVGISAINALTLSPALCAVLLRPGEGSRNWFFRGFNTGFEWFRKGYLWAVKWLIKGWPVVVAGFGALLVLTYIYFTTVPTGFVPMEDQGYFFVTMQGPEGSSLKRTTNLDQEVTKIILDIPGVKDAISIGGYNILSGTVDPGFVTQVVVLTPWDERKTPDLSAEAIIREVWKRTAHIQRALVFAFNSPPISGLSTTGGFEFVLQDLQGGELTALRDVAGDMIAAQNDYPALQGLSTTFEVDYPQYYIDLDR
ncbi:MAG: hydrophobe/amphiphile efflux-1 family RND transporter, partial [Deltaproteobacteria bacterium]|nr:hydrophobe/amphiphile efflux-1 family RND transporter [Deltaproteobacteria bacterium]